MRMMIRKGMAIAATLAVTATSVVAVSVMTASPAQAQVSSRCGYTSAEPVLTQGSSGNAVRQLQCQYNWSTTGTNLTIDGSFGPATAKAVLRFQKCVKIDADGSVGPITWSHLNYWAVRNDYPAGC